MYDKEDTTETLDSWSKKNFDKLQQYIDNLSEKDADYFALIGVHLSLFQIFQTFMDRLFSDFRQHFFDTHTVSDLPKQYRLKLLKERYSNKSGSITVNMFDELDAILNIKKDIRLDDIIKFKHFNKDSTVTSPNENVALLFEKLDEGFVPEKTWFYNLSETFNFDSQQDGSLEFQNTETINFMRWLENYSSDVRHVLAHHVPGNATRLKLQEYSRVYEVFRWALTEMYKRYVAIHNEVEIEDVDETIRIDFDDMI